MTPSTGAEHTGSNTNGTRPRTAYLICGTARSGSTLLGEALQNTGLAGRPKEYFNASDIRYWTQRWGVTSGREYLERALAEGTEGGVFGAKIYVDDLPALYAMIREVPGLESIPTPALIPAYFPNLTLLFITRRDKVAQAVSRWKLRQTRVSFKTETYTPPPARAPRYNYTLIDRYLQRTVLEEARWQDLFAQLSAVPLSIVYEDLAAAYDAMTDRLLDSMGITVPPGTVFKERRLQKQADAASEEWARRYREQKAREVFSANVPAIALRSAVDLLRETTEVRRYVVRRLRGGRYEPEMGYDWEVEAGQAR